MKNKLRINDGVFGMLCNLKKSRGLKNNFRKKNRCFDEKNEGNLIIEPLQETVKNDSSGQL